MGVQVAAEHLAVLFRHLVGKLPLHDLCQQGVGREVQPAQQEAHSFLVSMFHRAACQPFLFKGYCGGFLLFNNKVCVGNFVGMVFSQVVQQVQPIIGQFRRKGFLVLFHFLMDLVVKKRILDFDKGEEKGTRYPSECRH